jgi:hypothetical protein
VIKIIKLYFINNIMINKDVIPEVDIYSDGGSNPNPGT